MAQPMMNSRPRPRTLFVPRVRETNFILAVLATSMKLAVLLILIASLAGVGVVVGIGKAYVETAPELDIASFDDQAQTSFIYDASGNLITTYKGTEDRVLVSINEIPLNLQHAFVAVEDARFYTHAGVDVKRILGAFINNLSSSGTQGGSTITQQLIKQRMLTDEQSYKRKIQEAYLAMELESRYAKDQILESYLNTIFLGESYYGVKTAALGYFGKDLSQLTLRECAMLAGVTRSPYYYNPRRNFFTRYTATSDTPTITNNRTDYVLRMMYENQFITQDEYRAALDKSTASVLEKAPGSDGGMYDHAYYVEYALHDVVTRMLELYQYDDTSANRSLVERELRTGGYSIYLCIDPAIQDIVEDTLANWNNYPRLRDPSDKIYQARNADGTYTEIPQPQAAAAVYDYRTGELKAIVGGRYPPTQKLTLNRAWEMRMPVGSSIKPLSVYGPAIEMGQSPASIVYNMPIPIPGWRNAEGEDSFPQNYGGGGYTGSETLRAALRTSHNTSAAQALTQYVGVDNSYEFLVGLGVADRNINKDGYGLALGSSGVTPIQMAVAFGAIANNGVYLQPTSFSRVIDAGGNVILDTHVAQLRRQVFGVSTAWLVTDMLKEAVKSGTGSNAQIKGQTVGGKTGTNSDYRGVFFAGMTGWYSSAVWIGHDNYKALASDATGGEYAAPLWKAFMTQIHEQKGLDDRAIIDAAPESLGLIKVTTCGVSGLLATDACKSDINGYKTVTDYWLQGTQPTVYCPMHQQYEICTETGLIAGPYCPSRKTASAVFIPYGHPLYQYTKSYSSTIQKYLGKFATLNIGGGANERDAVLNGMQCTVHTSPQQTIYALPYIEGTPPAETQVEDARALISQAYETLAAYGYTLSTEEYRAFANAILTAEQTLYSNPSSASLDYALQTLRQTMARFN
ncbi:MAG: transglycosylase domain-containing protein [Oscillospiraceae bacterium]|jgi:penicillin-binding protein 1A|nr:transglycosylase domain-containing protein [Oscillospiraceae bacterium]